jgi:hypothetical protein
VFNSRDVVTISGNIDRHCFLEGHPSEKIDLERNQILDESFESIADGDDVVLFDEFGVISLEEGCGGGSLICNHTVNHRYLLSVSGVDLFLFKTDDFDVHVVTASDLLKVPELDEEWHCKRLFLRHDLLKNN